MVEYLTTQQLERLKSLAKAPRDRLLIDVQYETGCTVSELVQIQRTDIAPDHIDIDRRRCYVSRDLLAALHAYIATHDSPYVFCSRQSPQLTPKRVQQIVKKYLKGLDAGIEKKTPHLLRYTHIAHALRQRIPLRDIMKQTGLKPMRMAQLAEELGPTTGSYGGMLT